jgi:AraC-like DNA-binding protein
VTRALPSREVAQRLVFATGDVDAARDQVAATFAEHDMRVHGQPLDLRLDLAVAPRITVGFMTYRAHTVIEAGPMQSCYHVNLPLSGQSVVEQAGVRKVSRWGETGAALRPTAPLTLTWSPDQEQYVVRLHKEQFEAHAAKLAGRPVEPIDFDLTFDSSSPAALALLATARFVHAELIRPGGVAAIPAACHDLESALMTQLLTVIPSQLTRHLQADPSPVRRTRIHEVLDLVEDDPSADLTITELAFRASMSVRALQAGFQEVVGQSPTAYVRGVRLDRAHYDLLRGPESSVTEIAMRWGFYHQGRFAQQYRERFGVLPSETVRGQASRSRVS